MSEQGAQVASQVDEVAEKVAVASGTAPDTQLVLKDGTKIEIYKCKTRNIGSVLQLVSKVLEDLGVKDTKGAITVDLNDPAVMLKILAQSSGNVLEVAGDLCSLSHEQIADLEIDDTLKVVMRIVEVNKDFFSKNVLPIVQSALPAPNEKSTG